MTITLTVDELATMAPKDFRQIVRRGEYTGNSLNACKRYARTGFVIIPKEFALDFFIFLQRNPGLLPINDVTDVGSPHPMRMAPEADLRTDNALYAVFNDGKLVEEVTDITNYWRDDFIAFLTGCSLGLDAMLVANGIDYRFLGSYTTNLRCLPGGRIKGPLAVSCRLFKGGRNATRAVQIASRFPAFHGPPIHIGDPAAIGIKDLLHPDCVVAMENITPQEPDEVAMFWGCGYTLKLVAEESKLPFMITDGDAAMFITDRLAEELAVIS